VRAITSGSLRLIAGRMNQSTPRPVERRMAHPLRLHASLFALFAFTAVGCTVYSNPPPSSAPAAEATEVPGDGTEESAVETEAAAAPPAPQTEVVVVRPSPSHVWIAGHWVWQGHWVWAPGHWHAGRPGHVWVSGHWVAIGGGRHRWVRGHWRR
jgi:hypothetical protein